MLSCSSGNDDLIEHVLDLKVVLLLLVLGLKNLALSDGRELDSFPFARLAARQLSLLRGADSY